MNITYYFRKPSNDKFSIERVFNEVIKNLPDEIDYKKVFSKYESNNQFHILLNTINAIFYQNDINHITGDIHYVSLLLRKKNTILTIHDCTALERKSGLKKILIWFFWYWLPCRWSEIITVISKKTKDDLIEYVNCDPNKIHIVHDPIPSGFEFTPIIINQKNPIILQIGTKKNKNLSRVIRAIKDIKCNLRIIGKLNEKHEYLLEENNIFYSSASNLTDDEIIREYTEAHILIFASTYEGFGMPIIEAQAIGRPVVTSNIEPLVEVSGGAACFVDPYSVLSISKGIKRVIYEDDFRKTLIKRGLRNSKRFSSEAIVEKYVNLYNKIRSDRTMT